MPQSGFLPTATVVMMWVVLVLAVLILVASGIVFARGRRIFPGLRKLDLSSRRLALIGVLWSVFLMIDSVPRVTHASVVVQLAMSGLAFVPMVGAIAIAVHAARSKRRVAVQHESTATTPTEPGTIRPPQAG